MDELSVLVLMPTYNHERFISMAIEGVLIQKTTFPVKLIVSDDCSTDRTLEYISKYQGRANVEIVTITEDVNKGAFANGAKLRSLASDSKSKYIAICEGDDYWTDSLKLQKQVDFLEQNPLYALCFHQTKTVYEGGQEHLYNDFTEDKSFELIDLIQRPFISTVSSVFRNIQPLPDWFEETPGDWPFFLFLATHGNLYYMNDCMAVYNRHSGGIWSSLNNDTKYTNTINLLDKLDKIFDYKYHAYFEKSKEARYQIHYPPAPVVIKRSLLSRVKNKLKSLFLPAQH